MAFHDDEEKDTEDGELSEDALDEVLDEDEEDDDLVDDGAGEERDWA